MHTINAMGLAYVVWAYTEDALQEAYSLYIIKKSTNGRSRDPRLAQSAHRRKLGAQTPTKNGYFVAYL